MNRSIEAPRSAIIAAVCLVTLAGCRDENAGGHEDEHAGHVIPAHKPKLFPDAVRRLRELNDQFLRDGGGPGSGPSADPKPLAIALDIANWLPEIAADSDMPETPWNEVNARSARLVADYRELIAGTAAQSRREAERANAEIGNLEKLLNRADPVWFQGTGQVAATP